MFGVHDLKQMRIMVLNLYSYLICTRQKDTFQNMESV